MIIDVWIFLLSSDCLHQWIVDVLKTASKSFAELRLCKEFDAFLSAALRTQKLAIIETFLQNFPSSTRHLNYAYGIVIKKLSTNNKAERQAAFGLLPMIPPLAIDWIPMLDDQAKSQNKIENPDLLKLRASDFKELCDILITKPVTSKVGFDQEKELEQFLQVLNSASFDRKSSEVQWSGDLIANYCIANKLKSTFGKAQETLGAYEKTMRALANHFLKSPTSLEKIR